MLSISFELKNLGNRVIFAELTCFKCNREAISEVCGSGAKAIQQVIERWNSKWPEILSYLDSESEGIRYYG